ncbi:hypothetical protein J1N35_015348, partial [Gossypium stocksii]
MKIWKSKIILPRFSSILMRQYTRILELHLLGVARDMNGQWLFDFSRYLGKCLIFDAELWDIFEGLKLLQRRGHDRVIILLDGQDVIRAIQGSNLATSNSTLIRRIQSILSQENSWILHYIAREHNEVADCLKKEALSSRIELQFFNVPIPKVRRFIVIIMSNLAKLEFAALDILGKNYLSWVLDVEIYLDAKGLGNTILVDEEPSNQDNATAMIFICHHLHERLKVKYFIVKDPIVLWINLKERFNHQKMVILPKTRYDWKHLWLQDFKI